MPKKVKENLAEKNEALWALLNASLESALLIDLNGTILTLNERAAKRLGKASQELIGLDLYEYFPPDLADSRKAQADEVIRQKKAVCFHDEREGMLYENHVHPVFDEKGEVEALAIYAKDITESRHAKELLEISEKRYRSVIEDQTEIICRFKADGTYVFVNEIFCRFFGKSQEELMGHKWHPDAHSDDLEIIESKLVTMSPQEPVVLIENRVYSGKGEIHWMQFVNRGFYDENGVLQEVQSVGRDITTRKQAEKELFESEENFRVLYNNSPDMYVSVSPSDASIKQCNETLLINTGYSREEIIGSPVFKMYHDDCMDEVKKTFQQFVETGKIEDKELILKRKDGSKIDVSLNVNAVKDDTGKILHSISSWRDITERKRAEEQIAKNLKEKEILLKEVN
ncbi:PAS domain S-box protein, partial [Acidobacteriota bacterium]